MPVSLQPEAAPKGATPPRTGFALCTIALHPGSYAILNSRYPLAWEAWLAWHLDVLQVTESCCACSYHSS